ncbi:hypothetical protein [Bradyrhizobium symbiodeficiens]
MRAASGFFDVHRPSAILSAAPMDERSVEAEAEMSVCTDGNTDGLVAI